MGVVCTGIFFRGGVTGCAAVSIAFFDLENTKEERGIAEADCGCGVPIGIEKIVRGGRGKPNTIMKPNEAIYMVERKNV